MKFSVNWLREFVDLPQDIDKLADLLTRAGVEIEAIEQRGANVDRVVVAQITASSAHPNADRLSVCEVNDGSGIKRQIVCGAKNYQVGDKVPLALPGAKLPNGLEIKKSRLRGVESEGMLCSPIELGLGEDASGLLILSPETKVGMALGQLFPADTILDVEITPNRGDLLSHYGLAREIAALLGTPLRGVHAFDFVGGLGEPSLPSTMAITISAPNECPFFSLRRIENVKVAPSPQWLRARIESVGLRSINNIVDISNFVLLELGQPTHAFDADKLRGKINVRLARDGEKFLALDGKTYSLKSNNLVIADAERAVGIGGVMGGEETGVSDTTTTVLLESAYFLPASIRRTARNLNLPSDASYRFERGVDPGMILRASQRAADLIAQIAGGNPAGVVQAAGELPPTPAEVALEYDRCNRLLGIRVPPAEVDQILTRFGLNKIEQTRPIQSVESNKGTTRPDESSPWSVPSYRPDLRRDVDLIEEVIRAHGVQKIGGSDRSRFTPSSEADLEYDWEAELRARLEAHGLAETRTSKLIPRSAPAFSEGAIELRNPLSEDHVALRPSVVGGLIDVLARNVRAGAGKVAIFEIGRAFIPPSAKEERHLAILMWGKLSADVDWRSQSSRALDLLDLKGALHTVVPKLSLRRANYPDLALAAEVWMGDRMIGFAGQLADAKAPVPGAVFMAEVNADLLFRTREPRMKFQELERFPSISRDIAMIVRDRTTHEEIVRTIENPREPMLEAVELFDLFSGGEIGEHRKSLAYRLTYRERSRTLTGEEVNAAHARIRERLRQDLGAELRE
jgi:phenylalanyl-tRNA synthetase beta chain